MSKLNNGRIKVVKSAQELNEINVALQNQNDFLMRDSRTKVNAIEFHKQQSEFWASECISEQRKANVSIVVMMIVCVISVASLAMSMLQCQ